MDIIWGTPDYDRLVSCFEHIAMGVYRYHDGGMFKGKLKTHLGFLHTRDKNPTAFKDWIKHKAGKELENQAIHGTNRKVFYYQYTEQDQFGIYLVKLCFYENVDIYVAHMPEQTELPKSFTMELMNRGIKTIIKEDGKEFEFN